MTGGGGRIIRPKPAVPLYWWPLWAFLLVVGLVLFYLILTPIWMGIRFVAWLSEQRPRRR